MKIIEVHAASVDRLDSIDVIPLVRVVEDHNAPPIAGRVEDVSCINVLRFINGVEYDPPFFNIFQKLK